MYIAHHINVLVKRKYQFHKDKRWQFYNEVGRMHAIYSTARHRSTMSTAASARERQTIKQVKVTIVLHIESVWKAYSHPYPAHTVR